MSRGERKAMIRRDHPDLSLSQQCQVLAISRSSFYYAPRGERPENLALMRRIDELFLKYPFYGSRQMARHLRREGIEAGRHRVRRLMRLMGLEAIYQAPRTSTSPTSRSSAAFCIWSQLWTGPRAMSSRGGCRTPWIPDFVLRR
jgi:putative transposase